MEDRIHQSGVDSPWQRASNTELSCILSCKLNNFLNWTNNKASSNLRSAQLIWCNCDAILDIRGRCPLALSIVRTLAGKILTLINGDDLALFNVVKANITNLQHFRSRNDLKGIILTSSNIHNKHPISHLDRWVMGWLLWVQSHVFA